MRKVVSALVAALFAISATTAFAAKHMAAEKGMEGMEAKKEEKKADTKKADAKKAAKKEEKKEEKKEGEKK